MQISATKELTVGGLLITVEAMVAVYPQKQQGAAGGGMPDMNGMDF